MVLHDLQSVFAPCNVGRQCPQLQGQTLAQIARAYSDRVHFLQVCDRIFQLPILKVRQHVAQALGDIREALGEKTVFIDVFN